MDLTKKNESVYITKENLSLARNVVEANAFIKASGTLSSNAQKLLYTAISMIAIDDESFQTYTFEVKALKEFFRIKRNDFHKECENLADELMCKYFTIKNEDDKWEKYHILSNIKYDKGKLQLKLDDALKPFLLHLKKEFTSVPVQLLVLMKSYYSMRIYLYLRMYYNQQLYYSKNKNKEVQIIVPLAELENLFFDDKKAKYARFSNFNQRILKPSIEEINKMMDFIIDVEYIKEGKNIVQLQFNIRLKHLLETTKAMLLSQGDTYDLSQEILNDCYKNILKYLHKSFKIPKEDIIKAIKRHGIEEVMLGAISMDFYKNDGYEITNSTAFLTTLLNNSQNQYMIDVRKKYSNFEAVMGKIKNMLDNL